MFSVKNSFADCSTCDLLDCPSCILETNSKVNLGDVEVVFVAENPGKNEVEKELPLVGRSGKIFRKPFNKVKSSFKYLITNTVLCLTLNEDGTTGNPTPETIEKCKINCFNIIKQCDPKLIVLLGGSAMNAFGIAKTGVTDLRGKFYKWEGYDVLLTVHPSFANRNKTYIEKLEDDVNTAAEFVTKKEVEKIEHKKVKAGKKGIYRYDIPHKFYNEEYRLIDIQFLSNTRQILYIFRDKNNKKVFHKENDKYVCYQIPEGADARKILPYDELNQVTISYKEKTALDHEITYEGDMKLTTKRAIDYYHFNKGECKPVKDNILFADIEIDAGIDNRSFPDPKEALFPICMISTYFNGLYRCYILDNGTEPITKKEGCELKIFKDEKKLIDEFIRDYKSDDPDFMSGWNFIGFDMEYYFNRLKRLKIHPTKMSVFGEFYVDSFRYVCHLPGTVVIDQLFLYRSFTFTKKENYKLGTIAKIELDKEKIQLPIPINEMYWKKLNLLIEYNIRDTEILVDLEDKLKHINLINELRLICNTSFDSGGSPFGQIDSIMVSFLREKGLASKNSNPHVVKEKFPGAFVYEPTPGTYDTVTDFDFTSLYPSIIQTYNIGTNNFVMKLKDPHQGYDVIYDPDNLPDEVDVIMDPMFKAQNGKMPKKDIFKLIKEKDLIVTINGCFFKSQKTEPSIYSEVLANLLSSRKVYKGKALDAKESGDKETETLFDTKQMVYKVLANSLYGVIANKAFRFFDVSCAGAVTLGGQEALKYSIIEGDAFMKKLHTGDDYVKPAPITKKEMYADKMPDRNTEYIITGDTDSIFCCFENFPGKKTDDDVKSWCDKIQDFLNIEIIEKVVTGHNVSLDFNKLELKNELIISRGLFLAKKRYAIHVTNNEGRVVDRINYMGLETKRSDYPSMSKTFLEELIELILKTEKVSIPKLHKYIAQKEKEFIVAIREGDKRIARPCSYGKKLKDYKTIPQGVKAMEAFNGICYRAHNTGSKGYMYRISGLDEEKAPKDILEKWHSYTSKNGKVPVIAIPDEEEKLPEYFIPDLKGNLKFSFIDRYELLLKPLTEVKKEQDLLSF